METTRKIRKFILVAAVALCVFTLSSVISHAGVIDSKHNLSAFSFDMKSKAEYQTAYTFKTWQVCVFCHTPHGANSKIRPNMYIVNGTTLSYMNNSPAQGGPPMYLWNQALTNATGYTLYTSSTMSAFSNEIRIYSLMCLSCHDGVGAMNVMSNPPQLQDGDDIAPQDGYPDEGNETIPDNEDQMGDTAPSGVRDANIGERYSSYGGSDDGITKLANDHPISIDYTPTHPDVTSSNPGLYSPSSGSIGGLRLFRNAFTGQYSSLECSTCHDVHNQGDPDDPSSTFPFLAKSNQNSGLCLTCHRK